MNIVRLAVSAFSFWLKFDDFIPIQSIDCSEGHTWVDVILPLNLMSVAMDMTFKAFCRHPECVDGLTFYAAAE